MKNSFINEYINPFNWCYYITNLFYVFCLGNETREKRKEDELMDDKNYYTRNLLPKPKKHYQKRIKNYN